jgi:D-alanine-D-alanine ligase
MKAVTGRHVGPALNGVRSPTKRRLRIACAIDRDILRQVATGKPTSDRAHGIHDVYTSLMEVFSDVQLVPVADDLGQALEALHALEPDAVFNLALACTSVEACFAGALEFEGFAFTGAGPIGIGLSRDKIRSRQLLAAAGVDVPRFVEIPLRQRPDLRSLRPPLLVKPAYLGGASRGIHADSVVTTSSAAHRLARRVWAELGDSAVCDEFIVGRDFRVGVLEDARGDFRLLGVTESKFPRAVDGWGFKTYSIRMNSRVRRTQSVESVVASLTTAVRRRIADVAQITGRVLALRGYFTLDLRLDGQGRCFVVEANANPGLTRRSLIWGAPSLAQNLRHVVSRAMDRISG